ncbi:hypothetical protein Taro_008437 [Colocasia esculenta]|uniref:Uncharacterized protein n=1 Tax=Colocasia esculenta TaxID=4460 RepID=A0A843U6Z8_COLES|nr:hypothetical protein [Colocasia esculenta]
MITEEGKDKRRKRRQEQRESWRLHFGRKGGFGVEIGKDHLLEKGEGVRRHGIPFKEVWKEFETKRSHKIWPKDEPICT